MAQAVTDILDLKMNRKGFGQRRQVRAEVQDVYLSPIIEDIRAAGYSKSFGRITVHLARDFGFCYGVDRAVELAYETCRYNPGKRIFLTTEIIHNPTVNQNLLQMGLSFLSGRYKNADVADVTKDDLVMVPAFGSSVSELRRLSEIGCQLVDTTCGSVVNVWKRVERYAREGYTSVIHGKYYHEETEATCSRADVFGAHYIVVLDDREAVQVCEYMLHGGNKAAFMEKFKNAVSKGFDPDLHLSRIGVANQTTMLASESLHIASMFKQVLAQKQGGAEPESNSFLSFDTICSATQERQDAIISLKDKKPDLVLIVGGYNSSNTAHLHEIALGYAPSYHINAAECLLSGQSIRHKPFHSKDETETQNWLPAGSVVVGITGGASTPNKVTGEVLEKLIEIGA